VKGSNDDGVWNEQGASIGMTITPPWWRSRVAYAMYILALISSGITADRMRRRRLIAAAENERKTRELEEARQLQLSMLPKQLPQLGHVEIAVYMKTATEVGGDYYDFHETADGTLTVAIGDATGHGLKSGTVVTATKTLFEAIAGDPDIPKMFNYANKVFRSMNLRQLYMALSVLKLRDSRALLCAAGMPPVLIRRAADQRIEEYTLKGMPLGSVAHFPYEVREIDLLPGDVLILMSDGFPELFDEKGEQFGYDKASQLLQEAGSRSPHDIIHHFMQAGEKWAGKKAQDDDITFVVLKMKDEQTPSGSVFP
jgi:serine phosphatase RsbU (regulator of sigma subunit)